MRVRSEGSKDNSHLRTLQALSHCLSQPPCEAGIIRRLLLAQEEAKVGGNRNFFFGGAKARVGFYSPDQGSNLCPLYWKHRVLTTGPSGKSQILSLNSNTSFLLLSEEESGEVRKSGSDFLYVCPFRIKSRWFIVVQF